jgi:hypothetical protein
MNVHDEAADTYETIAGKFSGLFRKTPPCSPVKQRPYPAFHQQTNNDVSNTHD